MNSKTKVRRTAPLIVLTILIGIPIGVSAQSEQSVDVRCDDHVAAEAVARELQDLQSFPVTDAIEQSKSRLYYEQVMREPLEMPAIRIFYGTQLLQFGDLRLPKGRGPFPVAVVIHGGGWASSANLHYMASTAAELTCAGIATWNIEYRRVGSGGEWPNLFMDVAAATDFLRELALKYPLDLSRVISIGQSAGGHLALWLAARHRLPSSAELFTANPLPIVGAISQDGVPDLFAFQTAVPVPYVARFQQLFGGDCLFPALNGGSPAQIVQRMQEASPEALLPLGVPQVLVHGDQDPSVPFFLIPEYVAEAQAKGDQVQLFVVKGGFHFNSSDPADPQAGPAVRRAALSFVGLLHR